LNFTAAAREKEGRLSRGTSRHPHKNRFSLLKSNLVGRAEFPPTSVGEAPERSGQGENEKNRHQSIHGEDML
jgi:hypothetical protein